MHYTSQLLKLWEVFSYWVVIGRLITGTVKWYKSFTTDSSSCKLNYSAPSIGKLTCCNRRRFVGGGVIRPHIARWIHFVFPVALHCFQPLSNMNTGSAHQILLLRWQVTELHRSFRPITSVSNFDSLVYSWRQFSTEEALQRRMNICGWFWVVNWVTGERSSISEDPSQIHMEKLRKITKTSSYNRWLTKIRIECEIHVPWSYVCLFVFWG